VASEVENRDLTRAREALLSHYTSQLRNHGWYLLTSIVAILTGMQASVQLANRNTCFAIIVFSASVGFGLAFMIHSFGRILYYGRSCYWITRVKPKEGLQIKDRPCPQQETRLMQLSEAVKECIENEHKRLAWLFAGESSRLRLYFIIGVVFSLAASCAALIIFN